MKPIEIELAKLNGRIEQLYDRLVVKKIRRKYTVDDEIKIIIHKDENPEALAEHEAYVAQCKAEAKEEIYREAY